MKRMLFGAMLFLTGFFGMTALWIISIFEPQIYNGIQGFQGFLLGSGTTPFFIISCVLCAVGLVISLVEAYFRK